MVTQQRAPAIVWSWSHAALGLLYAAPAVVMMFIDPLKGLPLAVGVLPAAAAGLPGPAAAGWRSAWSASHAVCRW